MHCEIMKCEDPLYCVVTRNIANLNAKVHLVWVIWISSKIRNKNYSWCMGSPWCTSFKSIDLFWRHNSEDTSLETRYILCDTIFVPRTIFLWLCLVFQQIQEQLVQQVWPSSIELEELFHTNKLSLVISSSSKNYLSWALFG